MRNKNAAGFGILRRRLRRAIAAATAAVQIAACFCSASSAWAEDVFSSGFETLDETESLSETNPQTEKTEQNEPAPETADAIIPDPFENSDEPYPVYEESDTDGLISDFLPETSEAYSDSATDTDFGNEILDGFDFSEIEAAENETEIEFSDADAETEIVLSDEVVFSDGETAVVSVSFACRASEAEDAVISAEETRGGDPVLSEFSESGVSVLDVGLARPVSLAVSDACGNPVHPTSSVEVSYVPKDRFYTDEELPEIFVSDDGDIRSSDVFNDGGEAVFIEDGFLPFAVVEPASEERFFRAEFDGVRIFAEAEDSVFVPRGFSGSVEQVSDDGFDSAAASALGVSDVALVGFRSFFEIGGNVELDGGIVVSAEIGDVSDPKVFRVENGSAVPIDSETDGGTVSFIADSFGIYGICSALPAIASASDYGARITVYGDRPSDSSEDEEYADEPADEPGFETLSFVSVPNDGSDLYAEASVSEDLSVGDGESVVLRAVRDGELAENVADSVTADGVVCGIPDDAEGIAVALDTGYRNLELLAVPENAPPESGAPEVTLKGLLPKDAEAKALSADDSALLSLAAEANFPDSEIVAAYDVCIMNGDDEYEPLADRPVETTVCDGRIQAGDNLSIWHVTDEGEAEIVDEFETGDGFVRFAASAFSVYAIVSNPDLVPFQDDWPRVESVEQLASVGGEGVYVGHVDGYWFTDEQRAISSSRTGIVKTGQGVRPAEAGAALYFFEQVGADSFKAYCLASDGETRKYVRQKGNSLSLVGETDATAFTVSPFPNEPGSFEVIGTGGYRWNMRGGAGGSEFAAWNASSDPNARIVFALKNGPPVDSDPYDLDGKTYGLMRVVNGGYGRGLSVRKQGAGLSADALMARRSPDGDGTFLFIASDDDPAAWTFVAVGDGRYRLRSGDGESAAWLTMNSSSAGITADESAATAFELIPGTGDDAGRIALRADGRRLSYSETTSGRFFVPQAENAATESMLNLIDLTSYSDDDFVLFSAKKVSVSDEEQVFDGSRLIVYTRVWNEADKNYEFYAVGPNGELERVYEDGDEIRWAGTKILRVAWDFTEHFYEGTDVPNGYYDLRNTYSGKYLAPLTDGGRILSDAPVGVNLNGRKFGERCSTIVAWDGKYYSYAGLRAGDGFIEECPMNKASEFYFAVISPSTETGSLHEVDTLDHSSRGITMRMIDYDNVLVQGEDCTTSAFQHEVMGVSRYVNVVQNLVSHDLKEDGYPICVETGRSLGELFAGAREVNHLFPSGIYSTTGYFDYDSACNFASLGADGNFTVYEEIGTMDSSVRPSLKHGQFMPYNSIREGILTSHNRENLYDALLNPLSDDDPRKYERMFLVKNPDHYFGLEMTAAFTQTPDGLDDWGNDVVYYFTGDDDFWLYVDGNLVIDLGGIHSAFSGSVNYRTGEVIVNGTRTSLREIFRSNYELLHPEASASDVSAYLDSVFKENGFGGYSFKDYSSHTMKVFYMERGGGASNLRMKFNLTSVDDDGFLLSKKVSGTDDVDYEFGEYAFQVYYRTAADPQYRLIGAEVGGLPSAEIEGKGVPARRADSYSPPGSTLSYEDVFLLSDGERISVRLPEDAVDYYVVECGVNGEIYEKAVANGEPAEAVSTGDAHMTDYRCPAATLDERRSVEFDNVVSDEAMRTLTIVKKLVDADGNPVSGDETGFNFRLYLGNDGNLSPAFLRRYRIRNEAGEYCFWDADDGVFVSSGETDFSAFSPDEAESATFRTSPNGSITAVPAGYSVEVPNLLVGTKFRVEERSDEIPDGYRFLRYEREAGSYIVEDGDDVDSGTIRSSQSPAIDVVNEIGWTLNAEKIWSDASFVEERDPVYFAVYSGDSPVDGTVREITAERTSAEYYFSRLAAGTEFGDYAVYEVIPKGSFAVSSDGTVSGYSELERLEDGDSVLLSAKTPEESESADVEYFVGYERGEAHGFAENVRKDSVRNSRRGIRIEKVGTDGGPLSGAVFTLAAVGGDSVGNGSFVSGTDGLVCEAYLVSGVSYVLTETKPPSGMVGISGGIVLSVDSDGIVSASGEGSSFCSVTQADGGIPAVVRIVNRPFFLSAVKTDERSNPLGGATFSLHRTVDSGDGTFVKDYRPIAGFEALESDEDGLIPGIDENLAPGVYYLCEDSAPDGYSRASDVILTIGDDGTVSAVYDGGSSAPLSRTETEDGISYVLKIKNEKAETDDVLLTVTEEVAGALGNKAKNFVFTITAEDYSGTFQWMKNGEPQEPIASGETFELMHGDAAVFTVPKGTSVSVVQDNENYSVSVRTDEGEYEETDGKSVVLDRDRELDFLDVLDDDVPTGRRTDVEPFLIVVAVGCILLACSRKRRGRRLLPFA